MQLFARMLRIEPMLIILKVVEVEKLEAAWTRALVLILFWDREHVCCFLVLILKELLDVPLQVRLGELLLVEVSIPNHLLVHIVSILNIQSFGRSNCLINHIFHSFVLTCCIPWAFRDLWWLLSFYKSKIASNHFVRFFICLDSRFYLILYLWFSLLLQRVHTLGTLLVQFSPASELTSAVPMVVLN